ncbi:hypothetical protein BOH66_02535 [Microbacterium aurum]|uniref:Uncharacterized protein n=1 Tax=Microbacterium aurum TaxID=36805 RepID=A0A1P8U5A4_9MICO|nr:hypothetical protein [Microbacterium aurum]APZ33288.1 hypothetical protein BOH66_02535 [Microbacterium aurum]MBM7826905.1 hypothetical protein [Microbacterium aurum]
MAGTSEWRASDVVEHDLLRDAAAALTAALLGAAQSDDSIARSLRDQAGAVRREVASVDGYDRAAVTATRQRLAARLAELSAAADG